MEKVRVDTPSYQRICLSTSRRFWWFQGMKRRILGKWKRLLKTQISSIRHVSVKVKKIIPDRESPGTKSINLPTFQRLWFDVGSNVVVIWRLQWCLSWFEVWLFVGWFFFHYLSGKGANEIPCCIDYEGLLGFLQLYAGPITWAESFRPLLKDMLGHW